jgi:mono/diheme cytochrome c family protein
MRVSRPVLAVSLALLALGGCAKPQATTSESASAASAPASGAAGDVAHGHEIFSANCAQCHGEHGTEGGVGPSLTNEKARKNSAQTIAWIKNPEPPMPKLFPSPLSEKDVADVAAYVQSL